jgi:preprotein translocase subunit SecE
LEGERGKREGVFPPGLGKGGEGKIQLKRVPMGKEQPEKLEGRKGKKGSKKGKGSSSPEKGKLERPEKSKVAQLIEYIREAKEELDKVIFPTPTELKQGFISVISVVTVVTLFLALVNLIMGKWVEILL